LETNQAGVIPGGLLSRVIEQTTGFEPVALLEWMENTIHPACHLKAVSKMKV
jgi:hypothetical protein